MHVNISKLYTKSSQHLSFTQKGQNTAPNYIRETDVIWMLIYLLFFLRHAALNFIKEDVEVY